MKTHATVAHSAPPARRAPAAVHRASPDPRVRQALAAPRVMPRLTVGAPDDAFEREADRVAEEVMRMPDPGARSAADGQGPGGDVLRRAPTVNAPTPEDLLDDEQLATPAAGTVARKARAAGTGRDGHRALDDEAARIVASRGPGRPLATDTRRFFEPRLAADLGGVRLHDGSEAAGAAARLGARAFAYGSHVWLGAGEREGDRRLLGHELAHVLQAAGGSRAAPLRRSPRTNTLSLWDLYDSRGRDPSTITDADLRTTIEYEDYTRADLTWRFSDTVALAALRRSMDLFAAGVRGRVPNFLRAGREARAAAHGLASIVLAELGFTGDHPVTSVAGLGGAAGARVDDPDGSTPVWTAGTADHLVAYTLGTPPTMFARFTVSPAVATAVGGVRVRASVAGTVVGEAAGLRLDGGLIEDAAGGGRVTGIGGGSAIPGAVLGTQTVDFAFQTSTDGGRTWFSSGTALVPVAFTHAAPAPPGGVLREDVLDFGGLVIRVRGGSPAEALRWWVKTGVSYDPRMGMPAAFATGDACMAAFSGHHQCDSQAFLLRYLALSFGLPAIVLYFWLGSPGQRWHYRFGMWNGPTFQCDRPAEDRAVLHPHFNFHALAVINGVIHDAVYDMTGLPGILERAPGATAQTGSRAAYFAATSVYRPWTCPH